MTGDEKKAVVWHVGKWTMWYLLAVVTLEFVIVAAQAFWGK
jgi:hypothetical protein